MKDKPGYRHLEVEVESAHRLLDEAGVPREEYSAQGGGICTFSLAGRINRLAHPLDEATARAAAELTEKYRLAHFLEPEDAA